MNRSSEQKDVFLIIDDNAEKSVLSSIMSDPRAAEVAFEICEPTDFYIPRNRGLFEELREMFDKRIPIDELTVANTLAKSGKLEALGGREMIGQIVMAAPSAANVEQYCKIVREHTDRRSLQLLAQKITQSVETGNLEELIQGVHEESDKLMARQNGVSDEPTDLHDAAVPIAEDVLHGEPREYPGMATGIADGLFDELIGGIQRGKSIVLAARTGVGKTTLIDQIARGVKLNNPHEGDPLIITTEMAIEGMAKKGLASSANVHTRGLAKRDLDDFQKMKVRAVIQERRLAGVKVHYMAGKTPAQVRAVARAHQRRFGLPLLVVDLAAKLKGHGEGEREQLKDISDKIGNLKEELNCCVIMCVQLSRNVAMNADQRPTDRDLKGSGAWEEDADNILFIHRNKFDGGSAPDTEIILEKDRDHGESKSILLEYDRAMGIYRRSRNEA